MRSFPQKESPRVHRSRFAWAGAVSLVFWLGLQALAPGGTLAWTPAMYSAARGVERTLSRFAEFCTEGDVDPEAGIHAEETCLIGPEMGPLFTSLGQREAKKTALTPDLAALLVYLLTEAGVGQGDLVAVGASGSFPGLLVATLHAIDALDAEAATVLSLGASSFGATDAEFHLLDIHEVLLNDLTLGEGPVAVTMGGSRDVGGEFDPVLRDGLITEVEDRGENLLLEEDLVRNVAARMALYASQSRPPAAFVNLGGAEANLGTSAAVLSVRPGLNRPALNRPGLNRSGEDGGELRLPTESERGVLFEMMERGVPVIHLLHMRGLALAFGLPWDPTPLPPAGSTRLRDTQTPNGPWFWVLSLFYAGALLMVFVLPRGSTPATPTPSGQA